MARIPQAELDSRLRQNAIALLVKKMRGMETAEMDDFLGLFLTAPEKNNILRRIAILLLLNQGEKYRDIQKKLGISRSTISNIQDIRLGRGYGRNPARHRQPRALVIKPKRNRKMPRYKGWRLD